MSQEMIGAQPNVPSCQANLASQLSFEVCSCVTQLHQMNQETTSKKYNLSYYKSLEHPCLPLPVTKILKLLLFIQLSCHGALAPVLFRSASLTRFRSKCHIEVSSCKRSSLLSLMLDVDTKIVKLGQAPSALASRISRRVLLVSQALTPRVPQVPQHH